MTDANAINRSSGPIYIPENSDDEKHLILAPRVDYFGCVFLGLPGKDGKDGKLKSPKLSQQDAGDLDIGNLSGGAAHMLSILWQDFLKVYQDHKKLQGKMIEFSFKLSQAQAEDIVRKGWMEFGVGMAGGVLSLGLAFHGFNSTRKGINLQESALSKNVGVDAVQTSTLSKGLENIPFAVPVNPTRQYGKNPSIVPVKSESNAGNPATAPKNDPAKEAELLKNKGAFFTAIAMSSGQAVGAIFHVPASMAEADSILHQAESQIAQAQAQAESENSGKDLQMIDGIFSTIDKFFESNNGVMSTLAGQRYA